MARSTEPTAASGPTPDWDPLAALSRFERLHTRMFGEPAELPKVGRYELGERLGHGASGCVHRGTDPVLRRPVAIKLIAIPPELDDLGRDALMAEAHALASVDHPYLVEIYDAGTCALEDISGAMVLPQSVGEQQTVYLVMELVDGPSLQRWLAQKRSTAQILTVFAQLGEALGAAHRAGIVHRDFKPSNVAFDAEGRSKILDFGLAGPARTATTRYVDTLVGTPAFMAPEQHQGHRGGARADQFSYCVSLWEALAGSRPFLGPTIEDFAKQKSERRLNSITAVPRNIRAVLQRGLEPDPDARWPGMESLTRALRWARRRRGLAIGGLTLAITAGLAAWQLGPNDPCEADSEASRRVIWDDARAQTVGPALRGAIPFGADEAEALVVSRFQAVDAAWSEERERACRLEAPLREQALECLDDAAATARGVFDAIVRHPEARSVELLDLLPVPAECSSPALASGPPMSAYRDEIVLYRSRFRLGQLEPVLEHSTAVLEERTLPDAVRAEWLLISGLALAGLGRSDEAHEILRSSWAFAERAGNERAAAGALTALAGSLLSSDPKQARTLLEVADATRPSLGARRLVALDATWAHYHLNISGDVDAAMSRWDSVVDRVVEMENASATSVAVTDGIAKVLIEKGEFAAAEQRITRILEGPQRGQANPFVAGLFVTRGTSRWLQGDLGGAAVDLMPDEIDPLPSSAALALELLVRVAVARGEPSRAEKAIAGYRRRNPPRGGSDPALVAAAGLSLFRGELSAAERLPAPGKFEGADWEIDLLAAARSIIAERSVQAGEHLDDAVARMASVSSRGRHLLALDAAAVVAWTGDAERCAELLNVTRQAPGLHLRTRAEITAARAMLWAGRELEAESSLDMASSLLEQYRDPWVEGDAEVALLRSVLAARRGEHDAALELAARVLQERGGRGTLGLVEATAMLARDVDTEHRGRARSWAAELGRAAGTDEDVVAWLLDHPLGGRLSGQ